MSYGRFGVREICDVVFRPLSSLDIGNQHFDAMQPCLYLDTAQTSSLEGAATTVYAQGGKGNPRLIAWEGERTLTLNITDALMSTISFAMLSGAGVVESWEVDHYGEAESQAEYQTKRLKRAVFMHTTYDAPAIVSKDGAVSVKIDKEVLGNDVIFVSDNAPVYAVALNSAGGIKEYLPPISPDDITGGKKSINNEEANINGTTFSGADITFDIKQPTWATGGNSEGAYYMGVNHEQKIKNNDIIRIDCYTMHVSGATQINIDAENFAGFYYIEADTLFRDEETGKDFPAEFVIPRGKIQSNFTFSMAASGDPSTFDFVIDCFPAYTSFNKTKKVLAQLNVIDPAAEDSHPYPREVHGHYGRKSDKDIENFWTPAEESAPGGGSDDGNTQEP